MNKPCVCTVGINYVSSNDTHSEKTGHPGMEKENTGMNTVRLNTGRQFLPFCMVFLLLFPWRANAQSYESQGYSKVSATRFSLPADQSGLTDPGFVIWGKFTKTSLGESHYLYLRVIFEHSTANNPNPSFWYSYRNHDGKRYTDKEIGTAPFQSIRFYGATFAGRVMYGINTAKINIEGHDIPVRIGEVPKDFDVKNASVYIDELIRYNTDAFAVRDAIAHYEQQIKKKEEEKAQKEKQEAEEKRKREAEAEAQKLAAQREALAAQESDRQSSDRKATATESTTGFWSDSSPRTSGRSGGNDDFRPASQFQGGLGDINEGHYFKDDRGNYFQKIGDGARQVDKAAYKRAQADKINAQYARKEQRVQAFNTAVDRGLNVLTTSFYVQQLARGLKDAGYLGSDFKSVEELNAAFSQKLREISNMTEELRTASVQNANNYTEALTAGATTAGDQAYATALGVLGSVAASLSADRAEKEAREELNRQRAAAEAAIKERQRAALATARNEIGKAFPEGGMPLSSHKVDAPVLYLFAYSGDRTDWAKDQRVPLAVSNVIPVYRYTDGSYPYTSNVRRTFEEGGIVKPTIVGYFTDKAQAENYRRSLLRIAPDAKFTLNNVVLKVKPRNARDAQTTTGVEDFWESPKKEAETETNKTEQKKLNDFWNN